MVYLPTGSSDLLLILGCMTSNVLYLSFSALYSSSLWRTDTIVSFKLDKPPSPLLYLPPPSNGLEINKPPKWLNRGFTVSWFFNPQKIQGVPIKFIKFPARFYELIYYIKMYFTIICRFNLAYTLIHSRSQL